MPVDIDGVGPPLFSYIDKGIFHLGVLIHTVLFYQAHRDFASCVALLLLVRDVYYPKSSISTFWKGKELEKTEPLCDRGDETLNNMNTTKFIQNEFNVENKSNM